MSKLTEKELYGYLLLNDGFTVDTDLNLIEREKGYFVSISGIPSTFSIGVMNFELFKTIIREYQRSTLNNRLIGAWIEKDIVYIENSIFVEDLATALNLALEYNQIAIYDIENKESLYILESVEQKGKYEIIT